MHRNYQAIDATENLSEPQQQYLSSFTDNNAQYCFSLPNPQIQNLFNIPHHQQQEQPQTIIYRHFGPTNITSPQFLQPWELRREPQESIAHHSLGNKLGLVISSDNDESSGVFALHEVGLQQKFMPKICRQTQECSTAKQPFWNSDDSAMDDDDDISNADKKISQINVIRESNILDQNKHKQMRLYGELEAIYGLNTNNIVGETSFNQTGSSSALSSENSPVVEPNLPDPAAFRDQEALKKKKKKKNELDYNKKRKRKTKALFRSMARFFEGLVESVMTHQDRLHSSFLEAVERIDKEGSEREEARRREEAGAQSREAVERVREQAMASDREALIVSYLEKITGHRVGLGLPSRKISAGENLT